MAYEIGFVDNTGSEGLAHWQMLLKIKTLAEANGWTTLRYLNPTDGSNRELILQGVGLSGDKQIFIGFRSYHSVASDYYNLSCAGFTGYVAGNSFITQPGYFESGLPAHNQRIDYWITVNAQRVAFGLKVGTPVYEPGYAGFFFPYATPSQYPYPLAVVGSLNGVPATRYSDTSHSMGYKGNSAAFKIRTVAGVWITPFCDPYQFAIPNNVTYRDTGGRYKPKKVVIYDATNLYGEFDGIRHITGFNNVVENTFVNGGKTNVVIQDVSRTGFNDYFALELS